MFKQKLAKSILFFHDIPEYSYLSFGDQIQGPLTQNNIVNYIIKNLKETNEVYKNYHECVFKKYMIDDEFTNFSSAASPKYLFSEWEDTDETLEDFLDRIKLRCRHLEQMFSNLNSSLLRMRNSIYTNRTPTDKSTPEEFIKKIKNNKISVDSIKSCTESVLSDIECLDAIIENTKNSIPIHYMSEKIQMDVEQVVKVVQKNPTDIYTIRPEMMDNILVGAAIVMHPIYSNYIKYMTPRVKNNKSIAINGLYYNNGKKTDLSSFGPKIRDDETCFLIAYVNDSLNYYNGSKRLQNNYWFLKP